VEILNSTGGYLLIFIAISVIVFSVIDISKHFGLNSSAGKKWVCVVLVGCLFGVFLYFVSTERRAKKEMIQDIHHSKNNQVK